MAVVAAVGFASACSRQQDAALAPPIAGASPEAQLTWGNASQVPGTQVTRIELVGDGDRSGFSSGGYSSETRNILYLDPAEKTGRWLLPDSKHFFAARQELETEAGEPKAKRRVGTVALVKLADQDPDASEGRLLLFDPLGRTVEWLADGVRSLNAASVSPSGDLVILYEKNRQFVTAVVNGQTLKLTQEQVFDIPPLN